MEIVELKWLVYGITQGVAGPLIVLMLSNNALGYGLGMGSSSPCGAAFIVYGMF
jgi:hypothetical protein